MENSVYPDQTAPSGAVRSGPALFFVYVILSDTLVFEILGHLLYLLNMTTASWEKTDSTRIVSIGHGCPSYMTWDTEMSIV